MSELQNLADAVTDEQARLSPAGEGPKPKVLIRFDDYQVPEHGRPTLIRWVFPVLRETERCYVIERQYQWRDPPGYQQARPEQFVLKDRQGRRYAYLTETDALNSYVVRKKHAINHCRTRLHNQQAFLMEAQRQLSGDKPPQPMPGELSFV